MIKIIELNKDFYNLKAVKKTAKAYKELARFSIKDTGKKIEVTIKNIDEDVEDIIEDEFCNYVLSEVKNG